MSSTPLLLPLNWDAANWRKSSYSGGANDCVEIAELGLRVAIRDSKDPGRGALVLRRETVRAFVATMCSTDY